ncbi:MULTISPECIES: acetylserotonin O-methyltransferase [unclassified Bradyrhizobium]|uniref:acetylserotonin O-methyltransferase n=1 Tax=unclassified Bradyrhizobium TaxID=2631580 RepID=UPI001FFBE569|nr:MULTISPECIES: acetylserotonin O-methyltransferase [unclassified Bradyrhizobium]MCK1715238.1 methyltransferase [Bradyrhizobium sp. 143]MCK1727362.1 methyltransferase [Bradyrhizobium sp. 142]
MSSINPTLQVWHLIQSHRVTAVIYVAAKLGIPELLRDGPLSADELAKSTGADKQALSRLLVALSTIGICAAAGEDRYSLTDLGAVLDGTAEKSFKAWAIFEGQMLYSRWNGLLDSIMTGKTAAQLQGVGDSFELMARNPETVSIFNAAMVDVTRFVTPDVLRAYDFGGITHLMDVGGGSGELIGAVAKQYPHIRGTVFDLPRCAESATSHLDRMGVSGRTKFLPGDFFQTVPIGADAIIMKSIIHDWNDERSLKILANCRRALPENGKLLLVERILPELPNVSDEHREQAMSDLNMLRGPGGLERTEKQYSRLLDDAGFQQLAVLPAGRFGVIEARVR